jgi:hypothetical protein
LVAGPFGFARWTIQKTTSAYARLADELIERATEEQLAEVARLPALNIGYYHEKSSDVPQEELLRLIREEALDQKTQTLLVHGMQSLASALAEVMELSLEKANLFLFAFIQRYDEIKQHSNVFVTLFNYARLG